MVETARGPHTSEIREDQQIQWEIETDIEDEVNRYEKRLEDLLIQKGWGEEEIAHLCLVFREWLVNAMIYGNMGVNRERIGNDNDFYRVLDNMQKRARAEGKKVQVSGSVGPTRVEIRIQDQGKDSPEFWLETPPDITGQDKMKIHNRGLFFAKQFLNPISYKKNEKGVEVTLIRDLSQPLENQESA